MYLSAQRFVLDLRLSSPRRHLSGNQQTLARLSKLKAWICSDTSLTTIFAYLWNGYCFIPRDLKALVAMLEVQYRLIRLWNTGNRNRIDITKLNVTGMSVPTPSLANGEELSCYDVLTLPSWVRNVNIGTKAESATSPTLLADVTMEISKLLKVPKSSGSTTVPLGQRHTPHFAISSDSATEGSILQAIEAVSTRITWLRPIWSRLS